MLLSDHAKRFSVSRRQDLKKKHITLNEKQQWSIQPLASPLLDHHDHDTIIITIIIITIITITIIIINIISMTPRFLPSQRQEPLEVRKTLFSWDNYKSVHNPHIILLELFFLKLDKVALLVADPPSANFNYTDTHL